MTPEQLNAIKARVEAATPGPWHTSKYQVLALNERGECVGAVTAYDADDELLDGENYTFIAHARTDIPMLLAEVERLQKALDQECRLNGAGASREARLMAERDEAKAEAARCREAMERIQSTAGHSDAAEGCRIIIEIARQALKGDGK
jgi:hypothetical protein